MFLKYRKRKKKQKYQTTKSLIKETPNPSCFSKGNYKENLYQLTPQQSEHFLPWQTKLFIMGLAQNYSIQSEL